MPLNRHNTRHFVRALYAGQTQTITLLKRDDDQKEGTVRSVLLFDCRRSRILKRGEPIQGDMSVDHTTIWHLPRFELDRAGVNYINALDRIVDEAGRYWQPEADTPIDIKLFANMIAATCKRVDPPKVS